MWGNLVDIALGDGGGRIETPELVVGRPPLVCGRGCGENVVFSGIGGGEIVMEGGS